ncbi:sulfite exporter TauE/SafE family protein [Paracoccus sp. MBLB3053]|uniref:Probable membrane transporter protein n=1 Tax=Paracoccus aurantius TaxID=3073814 RepID=A0ABU2HZ72_9RHOB|nr:sulfite exporter TauE/SafE family protein [Paracoccus sp. MBLB3053]MDS9469579.1 sulfite exporter TauE/SafE family protein [Paracoccus sp. MBLB3053]
MDVATLIELVLALAVSGALIGFLAGLFGIGGGAISVPVFFEIFQLLGYAPEISMPLAVGTSLAVIVPTSIASARGHWHRGTVDMALLRIWAIPILIGVLAGSVIARYADPWVFQVVFVAVATVIAIRLLTGGQGWRLAETLPGRALLTIYGAVIGFLSALMGIGGGALSNLAMTLHGVPIHRAISTSAGVGVLIAIPGTLGYMAAGWGRAGLPPDALGFVSPITFALTIPTALLTARLGVRLAHALSRRHLEMAFGLFLLTVSARFLLGLLG